MIERATTWHLVEYREQPERANHDRTCSITFDLTHSYVRQAMLLLKADVTIRHSRLDAGPSQRPVIQLTRISVGTDLTRRGASGHPEASVRSVKNGHFTSANRSNSTSFANVLTPSSVHHHVHVC
jgi:hypothetical protein